jgi:hypothetical protein
MKHCFLAALISVSFIALADPGAPAAATIVAVSPGSGPSGGGTEVTIHGTGFLSGVQCLLPCPTTVAFDGTTVPLKAEADTRLVVVAPAHAPGTVEVTVSVAGKAPVTMPGAFTFSEAHEARYEKLLLPVYIDGFVSGAFGSRWETSLWIRNNAAGAVEIGPWACSGDQVCPSTYPLIYAFRSGRSVRNLPPLDEPADGNPSRLLYVDRNGVEDVSFSLRFADVSRASLDGGVDMPVIRERELRTGIAQLFNVPLGGSFRAMLRLYEADVSSAAFRVSFYPQSEGEESPVHSIELTATSPRSGEFRSKAAYVQVDLGELLKVEKAWPRMARIEVTPLTPGSRYWALISLTNNETQNVTLVTPQ